MKISTVHYSETLVTQMSKQDEPSVACVESEFETQRQDGRHISDGSSQNTCLEKSTAGNRNNGPSEQRHGTVCARSISSAVVLTAVVSLKLVFVLNEIQIVPSRCSFYPSLD